MLIKNKILELKKDINTIINKEEPNNKVDKSKRLDINKINSQTNFTSIH